MFPKGVMRPSERIEMQSDTYVNVDGYPIRVQMGVERFRKCDMVLSM